jgi:hypothetical protein
MRKLRREGFTVTLTRSSHYRIEHAELTRAVFASGTPGDRSVPTKVRAKIRRAMRDRGQP